eukprot:scaffold167071_cov31-Prasinocladus_malaysianus.AAC.1
MPPLHWCARQLVEDVADWLPCGKYSRHGVLDVKLGHHDEVLRVVQDALGVWQTRARATGDLHNLSVCFVHIGLAGKQTTPNISVSLGSATNL